MTRQRLCIFDTYHRIRPLRHRSAGHDARALTGLHRLGRHVARLDIFDDLKLNRCIGHIRTAHGKAVHSRHIVRRQVAVGADRFGQHAPQRLLQHHRLDTCHSDRFENDVQCFSHT